MKTPLSLYVHFPWCVKKCPYCDFNSHPLSQELDEASYVSRLLEDIEGDLALTEGRRVDTVFLGGGTPSLFSGEAIARLLGGIGERVHLATGAEITLEANPGTRDAANLAGYAEAGVNRLSIGAQSFDANQLAALGRIHTPDDTMATMELARASGITRINLDIMHGLPQQTIASALRDLDTAIGLGPDHISWYQLTIEPKTIFARQRPTLPGEDTLTAIEDAGMERLGEAGYRRYEISAYAREHEQARHNLNYWQFGDYLGIGAGAHGKITRGKVIERTQKPHQPRAYLGGTLQRERRAVTRLELPGEFLMNALRLIDGVDAALYEKRTGLPLVELEPRLTAWRQRGMLRNDRLALSAEGLRFLDTVVADFI